jgi:ribosomal protein L35AE/L33A
MWRRGDEDVASGRTTAQHGERGATRVRHDEDVASVRAWRRDDEGVAARR